MGRDRSNASFGRVEEKQAEMNFFLLQLSDSSDNPFAFRCYFSAFASAAMSVLYALESAHKQIDSDFFNWYEPKRKRLIEGDPVTQYVLARRHESIHIGETRVNSGQARQEEGEPVYEHFFSLGWQSAEPIKVDVLSACEYTHDAISDLLQEVLERFPRLSPSYCMNAETLKKEGLTVEDIEERLGLPRGWTFVDGCTDQQRLDALSVRL
jgi:hypothetical protein